MNRRTIATIVVGDHIIHLRTSISDAMMMFGCGPCWECGAKNDCGRKRNFVLLNTFISPACWLILIIHIRNLLSVSVTHDEASVVEFPFDAGRCATHLST